MMAAFKAQPDALSLSELSVQPPCTVATSLLISAPFPMSTSSADPDVAAYKGAMLSCTKCCPSCAMAQILLVKKGYAPS